MEVVKSPYFVLHRLDFYRVILDFMFVNIKVDFWGKNLKND